LIIALRQAISSSDIYSGREQIQKI